MSMEKSFKQSVIEGLKCYVYALIDPRDNRIFYVGKGTGNRVYQHAQAALVDDSQNLKLSTIREIKGLGLDVKYYIIRHNLTEQEAYLVESSIIDLLTYPAFNKENILTNIVSGHHQWNEGIKTDEEINILYDCPKIEPNPGDRLLLVSQNKSYKQSKATGVYRRASDYESARKYWKMAAWKAEKIDYILGVFKGIVRIVIKVNSHNFTSIGEHGETYNPPRCVFQGDIIEDSPYLNTDVSDYPFGSGGAITYIPRNNF
ncbi:MAG: endonuclease [Muribaculaceae bacterium]|nr:endonuclease [Muribaculaceae bacterium]